MPTHKLPFNDVFTQASFKLDPLLQDWMNVDQSRIESLPAKNRATMNQLSAAQGQSELARFRSSKLFPMVDRAGTPLIKLVIQVATIILSSLVFSAGAYLLTVRLDQFALPAAVLLAAATGYLAEERATKAVSYWQQHQQARKLRKTLDDEYQHHPPLNELHNQFLTAQRQLFRRIEFEQLSHQFPLGGLLAIALSVIEYKISAWLASTVLSVPGGESAQAIVAAVPIVLLWSAALCLTEYFERPQAAADLIQKYQRYLIAPEFFSLEEVKRIYCLDANLQFLAAGDPSGRLKNLGMALAEFEIQYYRQYQHCLEQERLRAIAAKREQFWNTHQQLCDRFLKPVGLSDEEFAWEQTQWVKQQGTHLESHLEQELAFLHYHYQHEIQACEAKIAAARKRQNAAYQAWCERRGFVS